MLKIFCPTILGECPAPLDMCWLSGIGSMTILFVVGFVNSLGRIGGVILHVRCIDPKDKVRIILND